MRALETEKKISFNAFHEKDKSVIYTALNTNRNYKDVLIETMVEDWVRYD